MQNQDQRELPSIRQTTDWLFIAARCHAGVFYPFMRVNMGAEGVGLFGIGSLLMLLFCAGAADDVGLLVLTVLWVVAAAFQRAWTYWKWTKGNVQHSRYTGDSWLASFFSQREEVQRILVEPCFCLLAGVLLWPQALGGFFLIGFGSLLIVQGFERQAIRVRVQQMNDAAIEGEFYAAKRRGE